MLVFLLDKIDSEGRSYHFSWWIRPTCRTRTFRLCWVWLKKHSTNCQNGSRTSTRGKLSYFRLPTSSAPFICWIITGSSISTVSLELPMFCQFCLSGHSAVCFTERNWCRLWSMPWKSDRFVLPSSPRVSILKETRFCFWCYCNGKAIDCFRIQKYGDRNHSLSPPLSICA